MKTYNTVLDLYSETVARNAIWRLFSEIPEFKILLPVYSRKLLVAADLKIKCFEVFGVELLPRLLIMKKNEIVNENIAKLQIDSHIK